MCPISAQTIMQKLCVCKGRIYNLSNLFKLYIISSWNSKNKNLKKGHENAAKRVDLSKFSLQGEGHIPYTAAHPYADSALPLIFESSERPYDPQPCWMMDFSMIF